MKKLAKGLLAMFMALSLVGCSGDSEGGSSSAAPLTEFNDYQTLANEMETWNILYTQSTKELNVLSNCIDSLLTNDTKGQLKSCIAKDWDKNEDATVWTFHLNEGIKWVNQKGEEKAEVTAQDWFTSLEYILNYAKNSGANSSMPREMIKGAEEYYNLTKDEYDATGKVSAETEAKFAEIVGIEAPDDYTLVYTMVAPKPYFDTLACYCALYPLSAAACEEYGIGDGGMGTAPEKIYYCGPYICTTYINGSYKELTPNPTWWDAANNTVFDKVTVQMVEDTQNAWEKFKNGELSYITLNEDALAEVMKAGEGSEFYDYLVETKPTKYAYVLHFNYNSKLDDGSDDVNWNTAIANTNFRKCWYYGIDWTDYLARSNSVNPGKLVYDVYTKDSLCFTKDGTDYIELVQEELGYKSENKSESVHARLDADKFAECKEAAIKELTAAGVKLPVTCYYTYMAGNQVAADTYKVMKQMIDKQLEGLVTLDYRTYTQSFATEIRKPEKWGIVVSGWGADFGDPCNYLGQEIDDSNAFFNAQYSNITTDICPEYQEFLDLYEEANVINDLDARYAAFAKAEANYIEHVWALPLYRAINWQITQVNDFSKIDAMYGNQFMRYVNWETTSALAYTADEYAAFEAKK